MGNRRTIRRFRAIISLVLAIPAFSFPQSEYQIISIPNNIISLALHNGFDAMKKNSHFHINSELIDSNDKSFSLLCFPAQINFLNYSNNNLNISFLDYGTFQDQIDNEIFNQFTAYEVMAKINFQNTISNLFNIEYSVSGLYSKIDNYTSTIITSDFKIYNQINNYDISFSLKNIGIVLEDYTNHSIEIPLKSQLSLIKSNKNNTSYFGYDIIYHFNFNNIEHIICFYTNVSDNINIMFSGSSYSKQLRIDDLNNDLLYGVGFGMNIQTKYNKKIDIGISSLGSAGYIYGLTYNF